MSNADFEEKEVIAFCGQYRDPVSGAYPLGNGYRMYLPYQMRFATPDTLSPFGAGGINPYVYCADEPLNHRDPTGHFMVGSVVLAAITAVLAGSGAALGGTSLLRGNKLRALEGDAPLALRTSRYASYGAIATSLLAIPLSLAGTFMPGQTGTAMLAGGLMLGGASVVGGLGAMGSINNLRSEFEHNQARAFQRSVQRRNATDPPLPNYDQVEGMSEIPSPDMSLPTWRGGISPPHFDTPFNTPSISREEGHAPLPQLPHHAAPQTLDERPEQPPAYDDSTSLSAYTFSVQSPTYPQGDSDSRWTAWERRADGAV